MQTDRISGQLLAAERRIWKLNNVAGESVEYLIRDVAAKIEPVKNAPAGILLETLSAEYFKTGSSLATYVALAMLIGAAEGNIDNLSKKIKFELGDPNLDGLKGVFVSAAFGRIGSVTEKGLVFLYDNYFPGAVNKDYRDQTWQKHNLVKMPDGNLLLEIKPLSRCVDLEVHTYKEGEREINIRHKATFQIPGNPDGKIENISGPNIFFKENKQKLLFTTAEEMGNWLSILNIIREPQV